MNTNDDNAAALTLYQKAGFDAVDRRKFLTCNKSLKTREWLLLTASIEQEA